MEAIFFAIDIVAIVWLVYWSIMNENRGEGVPPIGLFAYRETIGRADAASTSKREAQTPKRGF
jgi:hypothetical protein